MAEETSTEGPQVTIQLDPKTFEALRQSAEERGVAPNELAERFLRERLAHESERRVGRARPQRPEGQG